MLPVEMFDEVASFFKLFDLTTLKITNTLCREVAQRVAGNIRLSEHPGLTFDVRDTRILLRRDAAWDYDFLEFTDDEELAVYISSDLRNCVVGGLTARTSPRVMKAIQDVADAVVVMGTLTLYAEYFEDLEEIVGFVEPFRYVEKLNVWPWYDCPLSASLLQSLEDVCRRKRIGEFQGKPCKKITAP
ncbi:hypothetical protein AAVH_21569 [Aphelenchoides avenae]|nr:hypothetical protein AAVH_21569 [Aphelenchus avenae]